MKVLLVQPWGRVEGHPPIYTQLLVAGLAEQPDTTVDVLTLCGFVEPFEPPGRVELLEAAPSFDSEAWTSESFRLFGRNVVYYHLLSSFRTCWVAFRLRRGYDVVHVVDSTWIAAWFAWLLRGRPRGWVLTVIGVLRGRPSDQTYGRFHRWRSGTLVRLERLPIRSWVRRRIPMIAHTEPVAEWIRDEIAPAGSEPSVRVAPWGIASHEHLPPRAVSSAHLGLSTDPGVTRVLAFGQIQRRKHLLEVLDALSGSNLPVELVIAGPADVHRHDLEIEQAIADAGSGSSGRVVVRAGFVPAADVVHYYRSADAAIVNYGRFPNASGVLAHAIEYRTPAIVSDYGQVGDMVRDADIGVTFEPHDVSSIRSAIERFVSADEDRRAEWVRHMEQLGASLSWTEIAARHLPAYAEAAAQR